MCFQDNIIGVLVVLVASLLAGLLHACLLTRSYPPLVKHIVSIYCIVLCICWKKSVASSMLNILLRSSKQNLASFIETRRLRRSAMAKRHAKKTVYPYQTLPTTSHHKLSENRQFGAKKDQPWFLVVPLVSLPGPQLWDFEWVLCSRFQTHTRVFF